MRPRHSMLWACTSGLAVTLTGAAMGQARGDFDGDGRGDLAIGVPLEDIDGESNAGAVHVIYGARIGLRASGDEFWHQNSTGVRGEAESDGQFGSALAAGDFDGDGFDDLAIGAPFSDVQGVSNAGAVHVLYGSPGGLKSTNDDRWHQNAEGIDDDAEAEDQFGSALIAGDFDGDGRDDLAIGAPMEDHEGDTTLFDAGAVHILMGSNSGLRAQGQLYIVQNTFQVFGDAQAGDRFGAALASGDFDNNNRDDLAIGVPGDSVNGSSEAGAVNVLYGRAAGLSLDEGDLWTQDSAGLNNAAEPGDAFGSALAAGDFDGNGRDDLAIGIPNQNISSFDNAGAVQVLYGSNSGLRGADSQFWNQDSTDVGNTAEFDDQFGFALAAGDFDDDGEDDLAIGAPNENLGGIQNAGVIHILYGHSSGLRPSGDQVIHQDRPGFRDFAEDGDRFGAMLAVGDFDDDGAMDLAVSVPGEDISGVVDAGAVQVLYGKRNRKLSGSGDQLWHQNVGGIADSLEFEDALGASLGR